MKSLTKTYLYFVSLVLSIMPLSGYSQSIFGVDGMRGLDGQSGGNGRPRQDIFIFADGSYHYIDGSGEDGKDGAHGAQGGNATGIQPFCRKHLEGARGGDGGHGGHGGNGASARRVNIFYLDDDALKDIHVSLKGGKGGKGGYAGYAGKGLPCSMNPMLIQDDYPTPIKRDVIEKYPDGREFKKELTEYLYLQKTYYCRDGQDGKNGQNGRNGIDGADGDVYLYKGYQHPAELPIKHDSLQVKASHIVNKVIQMNTEFYRIHNGPLLSDESEYHNLYFYESVKRKINIDWQAAEDPDNVAMDISLKNDGSFKIKSTTHYLKFDSNQSCEKFVSIKVLAAYNKQEVDNQKDFATVKITNQDFHAYQQSAQSFTGCANEHAVNAL